MIHLLPINRVIAYIAAAYATLVVILTAAQVGDFRIALSLAGVLNLAILAFIYFAWRFIWWVCPPMNRWFFPNLNGRWSVEFHWYKNPEEKGIAHGTAVINQNFSRIGMEVHTEDSDSHTLLAQPRKDPESGTPILYYMYHAVPNAAGPKQESPYYGAAILRFSELSDGKLRGNYWTSRSTNGHFVLSRSV